MAQLPKNPKRLTTSACYISINSIMCCKIKKSNQIKTRGAAHKIRQLQINIRNLSWTSEVYLERFRRYMLCKIIVRLFYHAIISKFQKVFKNAFRIMKPHLCSRPCMILKRLDENCSRCNLKLLYIIPFFKISKSTKNLCDRQTKHSLNAYVL